MSVNCSVCGVVGFIPAVVELDDATGPSQPTSLRAVISGARSKT